MFIGIAAFLSGLASVIWARRNVRQVEARIQAGDDRYFDEQRAYQAYPHLRSVRWARISGVVLMLGGVGIVVLELVRA